MNRTIFSLLLVGLFSIPSFAIVDVTKMVRKYSKKSEDQQNLAIQLKATGSIEKGNTEKTTVSGASVLAYRSQQDLYLLMAETSYGESFNIVDKRASLGHLRWVRNLSGNLFLENYAQVQTDTFRRLELRSLAGSGVRYDFVNTEDQFLTFGVSAFYSEEDQKVLPEFTDGGLEVLVRVSSYVNSVLDLTDSLTLKTTVYFQPVWDEMSDHRLSGRISFINKLMKNLKFETALSINHDNEPPQGVDPTDTETSLGFVWSY